MDGISKHETSCCFSPHVSLARNDASLPETSQSHHFHLSQQSFHLMNAIVRLGSIHHDSAHVVASRKACRTLDSARRSAKSFARGTTAPVLPHPASFGSSTRTLYHGPHDIRDAKFTVVAIDPNTLLEQAGGTISQAMRPAFKHRALPQKASV